MPGFIYLEESVKQRIIKIVQNTLIDIDLHEPPINYDHVFENEKLGKDVYKTESFSSSALTSKIEKKNLKYLRGLLFVEDKQVFVIDDTDFI